MTSAAVGVECDPSPAADGRMQNGRRRFIDEERLHVERAVNLLTIFSRKCALKMMVEDGRQFPGGGDREVDEYQSGFAALQGLLTVTRICDA